MKTHIKISKNSQPVNSVNKPMQQKSITGVLQAYKKQTIQRMESEEEKPLQRKAVNRTGLPDNLKSGIEQLSGLSMDHVRVHYNSDKPAQLQASAYTQGSDIHVAPGQERHLPHEAWHAVQQMQGRVQPTTQLKGFHINDSSSLEREADVMGERAINRENLSRNVESMLSFSSQQKSNNTKCFQLVRPVGQVLNDANHCRVFSSREYKKEFINNIGHFDLHYKPKNKKISITLPVYFLNDRDSKKRMEPLDMEKTTVSGMSSKRKRFFKENIENMWSNKYKIKTDINGSPIETNHWNGLNDIDVFISVKETFLKSSAYFKITQNDIQYRSFVYKDTQNKGTVTLSKDAYLSSLKNRNARPSKQISGRYNRGELWRFNAYAHEAGHMLGLGDEYVISNYRVPDSGIGLIEDDGSVRNENTPGHFFQYKNNWYCFNNNRYLYLWGGTRNGTEIWLPQNSAIPGTKASHYDLTSAILGINYAKDEAIMKPNTGIVTDNNSLMNTGSTVKKHHYVTFVEALVQAIREKSIYSTDPCVSAPNQISDWTIKD